MQVRSSGSAVLHHADQFCHWARYHCIPVAIEGVRRQRGHMLLFEKLLFHAREIHESLR